ncbi:NAD(+)--dinitrogen-reductase ADP-D-ribosyltransferase [Pararhodospirillum photometricum]|uniref:NAD(+)--dinitrogen-reductase ADP-D-ribosyltransferase n=1 Tax=Pararhodospirillum photometricum DSM 122 TaxID=1150469 RepID=H6SMS6_PARPM|nr:NAD(+)--dinitrogen-reductase ADP-D-ribosyltransferase [Pararhodospirillum photometricum]CCG09211.1 NAD(+)--dinitrogen-reductase ADP-D-ribosyltransferase [Pararhodospirillum photometricum DSM 122]
MWDSTERLPSIGHSTNLVGIPTDLLANPQFNDAAPPMHISGVREMNGSLFEMLAQAPDLESAGEAFYKYMAAVYGLDPEQQEGPPPAKGAVRRFRSSYLRLLKGWGYDTNAREGAVLKGWVESRFGLFPTFHKAPIPRITAPSWAVYVEEKMASRFHNNAIYSQLDLLYEFCQWAIDRFMAPEGRKIRLYRGVNDFTEHQRVEQVDNRTVIIRLNNLVSFSSDRSVADCFGDTILEAWVPTSKIVFFNTLLPTHPLNGEGEYLVVGGDYLVKATYL